MRLVNSLLSQTAVLLLALLICAVTALVLAGTARSAYGKSCGTVYVNTDYGKLGGPVRAKRANCRRAKKVVRHALRHPDPEGNSYKGPKGWSCARGYAEADYAFVCSRGKALVWLMND